MNKVKGERDEMKVFKKTKLLIAIASGSLVSLICALICLGVAATMILNNNLDIRYEGIIVVGVHILTLFLGSITSGVLVDQPLPACAGTLSVLILFEVSANIFGYSGAFENVLGSVIGEIVGASLGLFLIISTKNKKRNRLKKYRTR